MVEIGALPAGLLDRLGPRAARAFGLSLAPTRPGLDPAPAHDPQRRQLLASRLLAELARFPAAHVVGVAAAALFDPVLSFVFGEAEFPGRAAVFSIHRLREEFYGLPPRFDLLLARATKEMLHELGHTFGLTHCRDAACVMSSSHSVEAVDRKGEGFCRRCADLVAAYHRGAGSG